MNYRKLLRHPNWFKRRSQILKLDKNCCINCGRKQHLHIHHLYYEYNRVPWDYPDNALVTLCSICHDKEHDNIDIKEFTKDNKKSPSFFPLFSRTHKSKPNRPLKVRKPRTEPKPKRDPYKNIKVTVDDYNWMKENKGKKFSIPT